MAEFGARRASVPVVTWEFVIDSQLNSRDGAGDWRVDRVRASGGSGGEGREVRRTSPQREYGARQHKGGAAPEVQRRWVRAPSCPPGQELLLLEPPPEAVLHARGEAAGLLAIRGLAATAGAALDLPDVSPPSDAACLLGRPPPMSSSTPAPNMTMNPTRLMIGKPPGLIGSAMPAMSSTRPRTNKAAACSRRRLDVARKSSASDVRRELRILSIESALDLFEHALLVLGEWHGTSPGTRSVARRLRVRRRVADFGGYLQPMIRVRSWRDHLVHATTSSEFVALTRIGRDRGRKSPRSGHESHRLGSCGLQTARKARFVADQVLDVVQECADRACRTRRRPRR